jgi:hypothetical protein
MHKYAEIKSGKLEIFWKEIKKSCGNKKAKSCEKLGNKNFIFQKMCFLERKILENVSCKNTFVTYCCFKRIMCKIKFTNK